MLIRKVSIAIIDSGKEDLEIFQRALHEFDIEVTVDLDLIRSEAFECWQSTFDEKMAMVIVCFRREDPGAILFLVNVVNTFYPRRTPVYVYSNSSLKDVFGERLPPGLAGWLHGRFSCDALQVYLKMLVGDLV